MPHARIPLWHRIVSGLTLLALAAAAGFPIVGVPMLAGACGSVPNPQRELERARALVHVADATTEADVFDGPPGGILTILVPDTTDTFWWLRALAILCATVGVLSIIATLFAGAIFPALVPVMGRIRLAGLGCILLAIGMAALQHFLKAYLSIVMFGTLVMGAIALALWLFPYGRLLVLRAIKKKDEHTFSTGVALVTAGDTRAGVALLTNSVPALAADPEARKEVLGLVQAGRSAASAVAQVVGIEAVPAAVKVDAQATQLDDSAPPAASGWKPGQ